MALFFQLDINEHTRLGIWRIEEPESFFLEKVPLKRDITHPHKRLQHLAGRYLLQALFPDFPYHEILIADTRKPFLSGEQYHFSISHCGDYAAALVSDRQRVGIDIELFTPKVEGIIHKFLSSAEQGFLDVRDRVHHAMVCWSAKEAVYKWYGDGEMDFIRNMPLRPFGLAEAGAVVCGFNKKGLDVLLPLTYRLFEGMCLVYVVTDVV